VASSFPDRASAKNKSASAAFKKATEIYLKAGETFASVMRIIKS